MTSRKASVRESRDGGAWRGAADAGRGGGAAERARRRAGGQVDLAPGADPRGAGGRRDPDQRVARRAGRARHRAGDAGLRRDRRAARAGRLARRGGRGRWLPGARERHRPWQFRDRGATGHGRDGDYRHHRDLHRRRQPARAPDGPDHRSAGAVRRRGARAAGRPAADHADRGARPDPGAVHDTDALGAGEVGGAARRAERAGRDRGDREGADARPYRADAAGLRRRGAERGHRRGAGHHAARPARAQPADDRGAARPELGGVSGGGGAARRRVGGAAPGDRAQPDAGGHLRDAGRDGGGHRLRAPSGGGRRAGCRPAGPFHRPEGNRGAAGAGGVDDRRVPDPRCAGGDRRRRDGDARHQGAARQGERPHRRDGARARGLRRQGRGGQRLPDRARPRAPAACRAASRWRAGSITGSRWRSSASASRQSGRSPSTMAPRSRRAFRASSS